MSIGKKNFEHSDYIPGSNESPENLADPDKISKANKLTEKSGIRQDVIGEITAAKLDLLKDHLPDKLVLSKNKDTNKLKSNDVMAFKSSDEILEEQSPFSFHKINEEQSNVKQTIDASIYSGKAIGNISIGLIKGIFNTPRDLISLLKGDKILKSPSPSEDFYT